MTTPKGYGSLENKNRFGAVIWRLLICERCGALVADATAAVSRHDRLHSNLRRVGVEANYG